MKDDRAYLQHIIECLDWIDRHLRGDRHAFFTDRKTQSAVLRELQTLAESTQRLAAQLKSNHPEIPWTNIAGFRNVLVHDYLGIKLQRVWEIIEHDLPLLRAAVAAMLVEIEERTGGVDA